MVDPSGFVDNDLRDEVITRLLTLPENKVRFQRI